MREHIMYLSSHSQMILLFMLALCLHQEVVAHNYVNNYDGVLDFRCPSGYINKCSFKVVLNSGFDLISLPAQHLTK